MIIATAAQQRLIEQNAVNLGMSELSMMENAGFLAAEYINEKYSVKDAVIAVLCGAGGNGGDGFALARKIAQLGARPVIILCCGTPKSKAASAMYSLAVSAAIPVVDGAKDSKRTAEAFSKCKLVVDAVFGVGFRGNLPRAAAEIIAEANGLSAPRVSLDMPSGLGADWPEAANGTFKADTTLYFVAKKPSLVLKSGLNFCGESVYIDVGIPEKAYQVPGGIRELNAECVSSKLPRKSPISHKGNFGRLLCLVGSERYRGAAVLCAMGAVRAGAGIVEVASCEQVLSAVAAHLPEPILYNIYLNNVDLLMQHITGASALVIGCGMDDGEDAEKLFDLALLGSSAPVVIDATGIKFAAKSINLISGANRPIILTPHPGEFSLLTGKAAAELAGPAGISAATEFARTHGCIVVLKGANTIIASPRGELLMNTNGNPGLAKGGSGDLLSGMIGGFLAMGIEPVSAAALGVYLHGAAADIAARNRNEYSVAPSDIANFIGNAIDEMWGLL